MHQHEEGFALRCCRAVGQELLKLNVAQRAQANANLALHIPDALAGHDVDAEAAAALSQARLILRVQHQPLSVKLSNLDRQLKIVTQDGFQSHGGTRALGQQTAVVQKHQIVDPRQGSLLDLAFDLLPGRNAQPVPQSLRTHAHQAEQALREGVGFR